MSEYQYYEFRAIDRPLTRQEQDELRAYSTRAEIDSRSFTNEYSYGDFRGNPEELTLRYFDAHLYIANWGTHRLMFRLPRNLIDVSAYEPYFDEECNDLTVTDEYVVVSFHSELEGGEGWIEGEGMIEDLLPVREELLAGDLRALYIAWLSSVTGEAWIEDEEAVMEPPVPPGLQNLSPALQAFAEFMRVDGDLLAVAAERSTKSVAGETPTTKDLSAWLAAQRQAQKDAWLLELLTQEGLGPRRTILHEFQKTRKGSQPAAEKPRSLAQLLAGVEEKEKERAAAEAAEREAERQRKAAERVRYLDGLAGREKKMWEQVEAAVDTKKPTGYAEAVKVLKDLRDLAERKGQREQMRTNLENLRTRHARKVTFIENLRKAGLID